MEGHDEDMVEINGTENRKIIEKINDTKNCFFFNMTNPL